MVRIPLLQAFQKEYLFSNIVAFNQYWKNGESYQYLTSPRPNNGLIYISCPRAVFYPERGEPIVANTGDIVLLPAGSHYYVTFTNDAAEESASILINFDLINEGGEKFSLGETLQLLPPKAQWGEAFARMAYIFRSRIYPHLELQSALCQFFLGLQSQSNQKAPSPIIRAKDHIDRHLSHPLSLPELAKLAGMSETVFRRQFKEHTGKSPVAYILAAKVQKAKELLYMQDLTLDEVSAVLGFCDTAYFCKVFKKQTGITPTQFRIQK
jgi:AraC-like DNA-binding protein